ncbi:hypothetical protein SHIRM173S_02957 [Streptomyces hirsutus]
MPYALCSSSNQPAPRPSSTRPPDIWSTWATWMARTPGRRKVPAVIRVPSRMRLVWARPARVIQASVGPGRPSGAHLEVVVGAEEGVEAEVLGGLGDGEQGVVGGPLLGLGEDPEIHSPILPARTRQARPARHAVPVPVPCPCPAVPVSLLADHQEHDPHDAGQGREGVDDDRCGAHACLPCRFSRRGIVGEFFRCSGLYCSGVPEVPVSCVQPDERRGGARTRRSPGPLYDRLSVRLSRPRPAETVRPGRDSRVRRSWSLRDTHSHRR